MTFVPYFPYGSLLGFLWSLGAEAPYENPLAQVSIVNFATTCCTASTTTCMPGSLILESW